MSQQNINRGSEWNRWDLHIHTKTSHDIGDQAYGGHDADELLIDALHTQNIKVAAITDHFCIDIDRFNQLNQIITDKKYDITLFPGVELRTDKGSTNIHVILIFDNFDYDSHQLKLLSDNFSYFVRNKSKGMRNEQTINEKNFNSVYWDYKDILEFAEKHDAIISIHAGKKSNGIDDKINNKEEINMAVKDDYATTVDIFEVSKQRDIKDYKHKVFQEVKERPVIICSDNHDPRKYDINNDKKLWIKAEPSFLGLKQAIMDPSDRVFVGEEPPKIKNINKFPEQYMSSICIKPKNNTEQNNWFDAEIPLSYGLTTIIGNKGNGKSALSDIISFVAESKNTDYFSFLTTDRFCEQENKYYKKYTSKITWKNGNITEKEDLDIQKSNKEQLKDKVKYLPQNYIENLCNSLNEDFQKEIDSLIFSYLNPDDRLETKNMNELINEKSKALSSQRKDLENKISNLNKELVELEKKYTIAEKNRIQTNLDNVNADYQKHLTSEPKSVESKKDDTSDFERKLDEINSKITSLNNQKNEYCHEKTCIAKNKNSLEQYKIDLKSLNNQFQELYENIKKINSGLVSQNYLQSNNILFNSLKDDIDKYITNLIGKEGELDITISNLDQDIKEQEQNLNQLKTSKSKQDHDIIRKLEWEKKSQEYLNKINKYKNQQKEFENYSNTINDIKTQRNQYINALSQCIDQEKEIYSDIYHTVNQKITTSLKDIEGVDISFDISLELDDNIIDFIYNTVNKSIQSPYHQVDKSFVQNMFLNTDLHHVENRLKLIDEILNDLSCSDNQKGIIDDKKYNKLIKDRVIFYNKISCLDYLKYNFVIKYEGKKLDLLSPGERGTVLLILFLILDRDKKPLIIDQPEDNLDNQTIYTKLVPSIKKAKQERQIVLVTHNPNLAIACDSELIISCKKQNTHIKYTSGSLENMSTKKILVDILEGTQPAFDLRGSNYNSEIFPKSSS